MNRRARLQAQQVLIYEKISVAEEILDDTLYLLEARINSGRHCRGWRRLRAALQLRVLALRLELRKAHVAEEVLLIVSYVNPKLAIVGLSALLAPRRDVLCSAAVLIEMHLAHVSAALHARQRRVAVTSGAEHTHIWSGGIGEQLSRG